MNQRPVQQAVVVDRPQILQLAPAEEQLHGPANAHRRCSLPLQLSYRCGVGRIQLNPLPGGQIHHEDAGGAKKGFGLDERRAPCHHLGCICPLFVKVDDAPAYKFVHFRVPN